MPSPFPGMDPFLEHPFFFPDFHGALIYCLRQALTRALPEPYYAVLNERLWVETNRRRIEPDVDVIRGASTAPPASIQASAGATAVLDRSQPFVITIPHEERRELYIGIMSRTDLNERVVTTIEVLSLSNKTPGDQGRDLYLRKQDEVLAARINLVEIDLLRAGVPTTAVPLDVLLQRSGPFDYHVCISPAIAWDQRYVYTFRMQDRLPTIEMPLLTKDESVQLDLQAALDRAYDDGPYARRVRRELDRIVPPLTPDYATWAAQVLNKK